MGKDLAGAGADAARTVALVVATTWGVLGCSSQMGSEPDGAADAVTGVALDTSSQGTPADGATDSPNGVICDPVQVMTFEAVLDAPAVLLLIDRSAAMNASSATDGPTKWEQVQTYLATLLTEWSGSVEWGLAFFGDGSSECSVANQLVVPLDIRNEAQIRAGLAGAGTPRGAAPAAAALRAARDYLRPLVTAGSKNILLVTDGHASCAGGDPLASDDAATLGVVSELASESISTFVLGAPTDGDTEAMATLNQLAVAGGHPAVGGDVAFTSAASAPDSLLSETGDPCVLTLAQPPPQPALVRVLINGVTVPEDANDGWMFGPLNRSLVFTGSYCAGLKAPTPGQTTTFRVIFGCTSGPIP